MQRRQFIALAGAAMAWPPAAHAQRKAIPVIGYLHFASPNYIPAPEFFLQGLREYGYVDGQNVALEYRWAGGEYDRLPALAAELVALGVDLIAAFGPPPAKAAKNATSTIRSSSRLATMPWRPDWWRAWPNPVAMQPA